MLTSRDSSQDGRVSTDKIEVELPPTQNNDTDEAGVSARVGPSRREILHLGGLVVAGAALGCGGSGGDQDGGLDAGVDGSSDADTTPTDADVNDDGGEDADIFEDADGVDADVDGDGEDDATVDADAEVDADVEDETPPGVGPMVMLHLTDSHVGAQDLALAALGFGFTGIAEAIAPDLIVVSGDLVDEGFEDSQWADYRDAASGIDPDMIIEVPGNHDAHSDVALANYLRNTVTGDATAALHGYRIVETGERAIRVIGVNTASGGSRTRNLTGYLEESQVDDLIARIDADPTPVDGTVIVGHHPLRGINGLELQGTARHLRRLMDHTDASVYLFGHVHLYAENWSDGVLMIQGPTLGNPSFITRAGFCVVAMDEFGPSAREFSLEVSGADASMVWPRVLITAPSDIDLGGRDANSRALPLARATAGQPLRAVVGSAGDPDDVSYRIDGGEWIPMDTVSTWWAAEIETPDASEMSVEVRALSGGGVDSHEITVRLE